MSRRRRPTRETVPAPSPTLAELAAEAHGRLGTYSLGEGGKATEPVPFSRGAVFCGYCSNRDAASGRTDGIVFPPHAACTFERCECACRKTSEPPCDQGCGRPMSEHFYTGTPDLCPKDPRDGSGVRDAITQTPGMDPELAALLGTEETR